MKGLGDRIRGSNIVLSRKVRQLEQELKIKQLEQQLQQAKLEQGAESAGVAILTSSGQVVPYEELRSVEIQKDSQQIQDEKAWVTDTQLAAKPYDPTSFLVLKDSNPIFFATVDQIAIDTAGLGWTLIPARTGKSGDTSERKIIDEFLEQPNSQGQSLREIMKNLMTDWGTVGYYGLEVVRNDGGKVSEIYHLPAHTLWVYKGEKKNGRWAGARQKFCQKQGTQKTWFKRFGLDKTISADTGEEGNFTGEAAGNELIWKSGYYALNDFYSVPNILPAVGAVWGLICVRDYNLSFFEKFGIPTYLIQLIGKWDKGADQQIATYMRTHFKGADKAHGTMVIRLPEDDQKIELTPLAVKEREGSFRLQVQIWQQDVLLVYSMPAYRIGILPPTGRLGGGPEARELTEVYKRSIIEPRQEDLEYIINNRLINEGLKCTSWKFKLNDLDTKDLDKAVDRATDLLEHGGLTPNELLESLDVGATYPEGNKHYMSANIKEIGVEREEKKNESNREV